jgi:hypothetical protein
VAAPRGLALDQDAVRWDRTHRNRLAEVQRHATIKGTSDTYIGVLDHAGRAGDSCSSPSSSTLTPSSRASARACRRVGLEAPASQRTRVLVDTPRRLARASRVKAAGATFARSRRSSRIRLMK